MLLAKHKMDAKVIFMNGEFIPAEQGVIPIRTHAFSYGTGCFEGIRGYWNEEDQQVYLFRIREHYERLLRSCKILQISLPYSVEQLVDISIELIRRNGQQQDVYLRPVAYKASETIGVRLHGIEDGFLITAEPMGDYVATTGLRCGVSSWRRIEDNAIPARAHIDPVTNIDYRSSGRGEVGSMTSMLQKLYHDAGHGGRED